MSEQERGLAQQRHADYFRALLAQSSNDMAAIGSDHPNYLAALRWLIAAGEAPAALQMCSDLAWFWETHGHTREGQALIRRSLALPGQVDAGQRISLLFKAANLSWQCHDFASADEFAGQAIALAQDERPAELAGLFNLQGRICIERGEFAGAEAALRRSDALARQNPGALDPSFPVLQLGEVAWMRGDLATAQSLFDQADALLADAGPDLARAMLHTDRAEIALARGDTAAARHELRLALPHARQHVRRLRFWLVTLAGLLLAETAGQAQNAAWSVQCLAAEAGLSERGSPLSPIYRTLITRRLEATRDLVGEPEWRDIWRTAHGRTAQKALAHAETWLARSDDQID